MKHERPYDTRVSAYRQSHYRAPRTLGECRFDRTPFEQSDTGYPVIWWICMLVIGLVSAAAIWVTR